MGDYPLVRQLTFSVPRPRDSSWARDESPPWHYLRYLFRGVPVKPIRTRQGDLQVTLTPNQPEHCLESAAFERKLEAWPKLSKVIEEAAGAKPASPRYGTISARSLAGRLPPVENAPPSYTRAVLRFRNMYDVPGALKAIREKYPREMDSEAPYGAAISKLENIENLVESVTWALRILFFAVLVYVCGTTAYQHVLKKTGDVGILRVHGLSPEGIARLYLVELSLLIWPAVVLGTVLANVCARVSNGKVASWVGNLGHPQAAGGPPSTDTPVVFRSLREGWAWGTPTLVLLSLCVLLVTSVTAWMTVRLLIRRKPIVDSLRGSA